MRLRTNLNMAVQLLSLKALVAALPNYHHFTQCWPEKSKLVAPIREQDSVISVPFKDFLRRTNYKVRLSGRENSHKDSYERRIKISSDTDAFQGFFTTINGTAMGGSIGRLTPFGTSVTGKHKMKQVKCMKTTDTIRHRGNKPEEYNNFEYVEVKWSADKNDCINNNNVDMKFQIFVAPNLPTADQLAQPDFSNVWYYTEVKCEELATESPGISDGLGNDSDSEFESFGILELGSEMAVGSENENENKNNGLDNSDDKDFKPITLKMAGFGFGGSTDGFEEDVQQKANIFRRPMEKIGKGGKYKPFDMDTMGIIDSAVDSTGFIEVETADWNEWTEWSDCSQECGYGEKTRTRQCLSSKTNQPVSDERCKGMAKHVSKCMKKKCPEWAEWQPWTKCSTSCGDGSRSRRRTCLYGNTCQGEPIERESCSIQECQTTTTEEPTTSEVKKEAFLFEGDCKDRYAFCEHWAEKGYCTQRFSKWMTRNCPTVCGQCQKKEKPKSTCQDKYPMSCPVWHGKGKCNDKDPFVREFVNNNCKSTCGVC